MADRSGVGRLIELIITIDGNRHYGAEEIVEYNDLMCSLSPKKINEAYTEAYQFLGYERKENNE